MLEKREFYINGQWVQPSAANDCAVIDPSTEDPCTVISLGSQADTDAAVAAAKAALPGWMATPGEDQIQRDFHDAEEGWLERAAASRPFGRLIDPAELARTICILASDASGLMTGATIDFEQSVAGAGDAPVPGTEPTWGEPT